jgi:hypothetical protein
LRASVLAHGHQGAQALAEDHFVCESIQFSTLRRAWLRF